MNPVPIRTRRVVGVMTGTSIDGVDAALVTIEGSGLEMRSTLVSHVSRPLGDLQPLLRDAATQKPMSAGEFARLAWDFGRLHAEVIAELLAGQASPFLICVHGQTIFHQPPHSWQLVNTAPIAARFGCPVISDLRQADLAAGGQGAPITPIADWILFRDAQRSRAIINLGGFCNVTILPPSPDGSSQEVHAIRGFDVCACNQLIDAAARAVLGTAFDDGGHAARHGQASTAAAESLRVILSRQRAARRSLGTGDEGMAWLEMHQSAMPANDLMASVTEAIGAVIASALDEHQPDELIVAGGGARNQSLTAAIARQSQRPIRSSVDFGVPIEAREAIAFAILGTLCADGVPITLPQVTGSAAPASPSGSCQPVMLRFENQCDS